MPRLSALVLLGLLAALPGAPARAQLPTVLPLWNEIRRECPVWRSELNRAVEIGNELHGEAFEQVVRRALLVDAGLPLPRLRFSYLDRGYRCEATVGSLTREQHKRYLELARIYLDWRVRGFSAAFALDGLRQRVTEPAPLPPGPESTLPLREQVARLLPPERVEDGAWVTPNQVVLLHGRRGVKVHYLARDERLALVFYSEPEADGRRRVRHLIADRQEVSPELSRTFLHALEDAAARTQAREDLVPADRPTAFWHEVKRELRDRYGKSWLSPRELGYDRESL